MRGEGTGPGVSPLGCREAQAAGNEQAVQTVEEELDQERVAQAELGCELPYELEGRLRRLVEQHGATLLDVRHEGRVHMRFALPVTSRTAFTAAIDEAAQGRIAWDRESSIASP